jgi:hypothetical protein
MCRNIKTLFNFEPPVTDDEIRAASLQFVRKISGFTNPSKANERAFRAAVDEVACVSARLLRRSRPAHRPKTAQKRRSRLKPAPLRALAIESPLFKFQKKAAPTASERIWLLSKISNLYAAMNVK